MRASQLLLCYGFFSLVRFGEWALCFDYLISVNPLQLLLYNRLCGYGRIVYSNVFTTVKMTEPNANVKRRQTRNRGSGAVNRWLLLIHFGVMFHVELCVSFFYVLGNRMNFEALRARLHFFPLYNRERKRNTKTERHFFLKHIFLMRKERNVISLIQLIWWYFRHPSPS